MQKRLLPLDALVMGLHHHSASARTASLVSYLRTHPAVRSFGSVEDINEGKKLIAEGKVNTVFIDPLNVWNRSDGYAMNVIDTLNFILEMRKSHPRILFIFYSRPIEIKGFEKFNERFKHYYRVNSEILLRYEKKHNKHSTFFIRNWTLHPQSIAELNRQMDRCQLWHKELFYYDVALSFAGEDREFAENLAHALKNKELQVFYDKFLESKLIGENICTTLYDVFSTQSRYCILLVSNAYRDKIWTIHELSAAQQRALQERGSNYLIPVRMDKVSLPGLLETIGYVSYKRGAEEIANMISNKIFHDPSTKKEKIGFWLFERT